jgi:hypothetical protein
VDSPYKSDGLVLLWFFRRGGQTGASGSSLPLALFLLASRWTYMMELRCKAGPSDGPIPDTDLLRLLNPCPLNRVVPKNAVIHVTVFDPDIPQGLGNFCRRGRYWIVLIYKVSAQLPESDESQAYLRPAKTLQIH